MNVYKKPEEIKGKKLLETIVENLVKWQLQKMAYKN